MIQYPKVLFDGDFKLEKVTPSFEHARDVFAIIDAQRDYLAPWLEWVDVSLRPEDMFPHMHRIAPTDNPSYYITYDGKIIGNINFVRVNERHKTAEIGYWLSKDFNGRGIMTRAVREMERLGFEVLGYNRIELQIIVENLPSQGVAARCGYLREGVMRGAFIMRGVPRDVVLFSKLKSDWEKENKNA